MKIVSWFKKLKWIVDNWDDFNSEVINRIRKAENLIKYRTAISADVNFHGGNRNQIVVIGRYSNTDYIQVFTIDDKGFTGLIENLREMEKFGVVDKVDAMPEIRATIKRDLKF